MRKIIHKKILSEYFEAVLSGEKRFEIRKDEDNIQVGDLVILHEYLDDFTGRTEGVKVRYVLRDIPEYGLMPGFCIFCW